MNKAELALIIESEQVIANANWSMAHIEKIIEEIETIEAQGFTRKSQKRWDELREQLKTFLARQQIERDILNKTEKKVTKLIKSKNREK